MKIKPKIFETVEVFVLDQTFVIPPEGRDLPDAVIEKLLEDYSDKFQAGGED